MHNNYNIRVGTRNCLDQVVPISLHISNAFEEVQGSALVLRTRNAKDLGYFDHLRSLQPI